MMKMTVLKICSSRPLNESDKQLTMREVARLAGFQINKGDYGEGFVAGYNGNKSMIRRMMDRPVSAAMVGHFFALVFTKDGYKNIRAFTICHRQPLDGWEFPKVGAVELPKAIEHFNKTHEHVQKIAFEPIKFDTTYSIKGGWHGEIFFKKMKKGLPVFVHPTGSHMSLANVLYYIGKDTKFNLPEGVENKLYKLKVMEKI